MSISGAPVTQQMEREIGAAAYSEEALCLKK